MSIKSKNRQPIDEGVFFAQVYCPITENLIRVKFKKGDKVRDLVDVVFKRWGISFDRGWLPVVAYGLESFQLHLDEEIPTDVNNFFEEHKDEFVFIEPQAERQGKKEYRRYGNAIRPIGEYSMDFKDGRPIKGKEWGNDEIRIMIVSSIAGG